MSCNLKFKFLKHSKYKHNYSYSQPYYTALLTPSLTMRFLSSFLAQQTVNIDLIQTIFASSYMTSFQSFPNNRNSICQNVTNFLVLTYEWFFIHIYPLISPYTLVPQVLFSPSTCVRKTLLKKKTKQQHNTLLPIMKYSSFLMKWLGSFQRFPYFNSPLCQHSLKSYYFCLHLQTDGYFCIRKL